MYGKILKQSNLPTVRKRSYNTQTVPKPVTSQEKMVQHSNRAKTCQQSEKDGTQTEPKPSQQSEKDGTTLKWGQSLSTFRKRWYSNRAKTCHQSEIDGTILK